MDNEKTGDALLLESISCKNSIFHVVIFAAYLLPTRSLFKKSGHVAGQLTTPKQALFPQIDVQRRTQKR
ncbi:MAG: hypothetical protein IJQ98_01425 [Oscillospiraceae bacterium]|nr:hypothetical protein [Oscillospiraceae bacterium]